MKQYLDMLEHLLTKGKDRPDRTGTGTRGVFGYQMRFNLEEGFPLLTTKKVFTKGIIHELIWFLKGDTNIRYLALNGVRIWHDWALKKYLKAVNSSSKPGTPEWKEELNHFDDRIKADEEFARVWGELGPVYGQQWRDWEYWGAIHDPKPRFGLCHLDQIANLVRDLKTNPYSRRHIVSAWNPPDIPDMALPPCHTLWQCYVETAANCVGPQSSTLSLHLYARSIDSFLGLPFNIASYAMLLTMLAQVTSMSPGELIISFGDLHLYRNHFEQAKLQLTRGPRKLSRLVLPTKEKLEDYVFEDFQIVGYDPHPEIKAPISV